MRLLRTLIFATAPLLLLAGAFAQDAHVKHFATGGVSSDSSNGWTIGEQLNVYAQQLSLTRGDEAMIKFFVHRGRVNSPDKMAQAKSKLIDPYVEFTAKQFAQMGAKPERI